MRNLKLSTGIATNPTLSKLASYIERAQIMFSALVYRKNNQNYLINKNQDTPYIQLDWKMYCIMRSWARTIITSGQNVRYEKGVYMDLRTFGDKDLQELFEKNRHKKQNIVVFSTKLTDAQIHQSISSQIYQYLSIKHKLMQDSEPPYKTSDVLKSVKKFPDSCPILMAAGTTITSQLLDQESDILDLLIISQYEGQINQQSIGHKFDMDIQKKYQKVWTSQTVQIEIKNHKKAKLTFSVYIPDRKLK